MAEVKGCTEVNTAPYSWARAFSSRKKGRCSSLSQLRNTSNRRNPSPSSRSSARSVSMGYRQAVLMPVSMVPPPFL